MKEAIKYGYFAFKEMLDFGNRYEEYGLCGRYARLHPEAGRKAVGQGDEEEVLCKPHSRGIVSPEYNRLSEEQRALLKSGNATEEQVMKWIEELYPVNSPIRAYVQFLTKLGLVKIDFEDNRKLMITERGHQFLEGKITDEEMMIQALTDWKYPRTREDVYPIAEWKGYNIRPLMATIAVIERVNQADERNGIKPNGITLDEFMVYLMTMYSCGQIDDRVPALWNGCIIKRSRLENQHTTRKCRRTKKSL